MCGACGRRVDEVEGSSGSNDSELLRMCCTAVATSLRRPSSAKPFSTIRPSSAALRTVSALAPRAAKTSCQAAALASWPRPINRARGTPRQVPARSGAATGCGRGRRRQRPGHRVYASAVSAESRSSADIDSPKSSTDCLCTRLTCASETLTKSRMHPSDPVQHPARRRGHGMKRFVLITAALGALVASRAAVAHLKAADVAAASATLSAPTRRTSRPGRRPATARPSKSRPAARPAPASTTPTSPGPRAPPQQRLQHDDEARQGRRQAEDRRRRRPSHAGFSGVNTDGKLDAWVRGSAGHGDGTLFGSLSGSFSKTGGRPTARSAPAPARTPR